MLMPLSPRNAKAAELSPRLSPRAPRKQILQKRFEVPSLHLGSSSTGVSKLKNCVNMSNEPYACPTGSRSRSSCISACTTRHVLAQSDEQDGHTHFATSLVEVRAPGMTQSELRIDACGRRCDSTLMDDVPTVSGQQQLTSSMAMAMPNASVRFCLMSILPKVALTH
jgi:hypothetical protein